MIDTPEILSEIKGSVGVITLNRPEALNALTYNMVQLLDKQLIDWAEDDAVKAVIIQGAGDRAFCAGGDVKSVILDAMAAKKGESDGALPRNFFKEEYILNNRIFDYPKPYISIVNGIVMGGGKGISAHGSHRIVTEKTLFAMPETNIGFFPDVGGGYFLPRCPGETGTYLALTSKRIKAIDTLYIGFATHFIPASKIEALEIKIAEAPENLDSLLKEFSEVCEGVSEIEPYREKIDQYFAHNDIEAIMADLESDNSDWALETLKSMKAMSPTSLKIALKQIRKGKNMSFSEVMTMEYRLSQACLQGHDFYEGVRAALIDKDRQPKWSPAEVREVLNENIDKCFQPLGAQDLVL